MNSKEIEEALQDAKRKGWVKEKNGKFKLTKKGAKYIEGKFPESVKRMKVAKTSLKEFMESAEIEGSREIVLGLNEQVSEGKLVKIIHKGKIAWIDSRSKKPENSIVLQGKFQ